MIHDSDATESSNTLAKDGPDSFYRFSGVVRVLLGGLVADLRYSICFWNFSESSFCNLSFKDSKRPWRLQRRPSPLLELSDLGLCDGCM